MAPGLDLPTSQGTSKRTENFRDHEICHKAGDHQKMTWLKVLCPFPYCKKSWSRGFQHSCISPSYRKTPLPNPLSSYLCCGSTAKTKMLRICSALDSLALNGHTKSWEWSWVRRRQSRPLDTSFGAKTLNHVCKILVCSSKKDLGKKVCSPGEKGLQCKTMPLAKQDSICIS